jgi:hypothetical protein
MTVRQREAARRARFVRDAVPTRLGNIASELNRLAARVSAGHAPDAVVGQMTRIASMMEWLAEGATEQVADMQREICRWRRVWPLEGAQSLLAFRARQMSRELIEASGLIET